MNSCPLARVIASVLIRVALLLAPLAQAGLAHPAAAQTTGSVIGRVTDADRGTPLRNIVVSAVGTRSSTLTGDDGLYTLSGLAPGRYVLEFRWLGYQTHRVNVTVPARGTARTDARLDPAPIRIGEIVVTTASRQPERVAESPSAVAVIPPGRVQDLIVSDQVPLFVAELPGVYAMQTGVNTFALNARGFNGLQNRRMMILVDGRDVTAPILTTPEWPSVSIYEDGTQVELVRGPGSALYGANAFSGVLNVVTPSIRRAAGTRLTLAGGQLSHMRAEGRHSHVTDDLRWGFRVQGGYTRTLTWDRSRTDLGDLATEYEDAVPGSTTITHPPPGYELLPLAGQTKAGPAGTPGPSTGDPDPMTTARGSARIDYYKRDGSVVTTEGGFTRIGNLLDVSSAGRGRTDRSDLPWARLAWEADHFNLMAYYTGRRGEATLLNSGSTVLDSSDRIHVEGQLSRSFARDRGRAVLGSSFRTERIDSEGTLLAAREDGRRDNYYAVFGQVSYDITDDVRFLAAGRLDDASLYDLQFAPKVGVVWNPTDRHTFRASFNQAYLMPSPTQRFLRVAAGPPQDLTSLEDGLRASPLGPSLLEVPQGELFTNSAAVPILVLGNENMDAEGVTSVELGYRAEFERAYLTLDLHRSRFDNFASGPLPGVNSDYPAWTAPADVASEDRAAVEGAVMSAVPLASRLPDGSTALVLSSATGGEADQLGLDLSATVMVTDRISVASSYSFVDVDFAGGFLGADSIPTNTPTHMGKASVSYRASDGTSARLGITMVDSFDFVWGTWTGTVPGRQTIDVDFGYPLRDDIRLSVSASNLLAQKRFHHYGGSVIGRRLLVSLTWGP
jgi:outer membrane receptor protein involved in Fe transport